jgi:hypothetical protein
VGEEQALAWRKEAWEGHEDIAEETDRSDAEEEEDLAEDGRVEEGVS